MPRPSTILPALLIALLGALSAGCGAAPARTAAGAPAGTPTSSPSEPAGVSPTTPPDRSYPVGQRVLRLNRGGDRPLPVTVWYPAAGAATARGEARDGAEPARGRFPVVVFSHGLTGSPADYEPLLAAWAAGGFVVAAPAYPHTHAGAAEVNVLDVLNQPADASHVLTELLALDTADGDPLRGRLDGERIGAAGHSAGGITTVGLFTTARDDRLDAGVVLSGSSLGVGTNFIGNPAPLLFVHGARDEVVSYASGRAAYDAVPWPKAMLTLSDGDHGRALSNRDDPAFRLVATATLEFLRWSLYGDQSAKPRLAAASTGGGLATLDGTL